MVSRVPQNGFICGFLARFLARFLPGLLKAADRPKLSPRRGNGAREKNNNENN
jgi:hypothetical protein